MESSIAQNQYLIWNPSVKKFLSISVFIFVFIIFLLLIVNFFLSHLSLISILGTLILVLGNIFESVNLWFSFNGYFRKFPIIIIFTLLTVIGLILYVISPAVSKAITLTRIMMEMIQMLYLTYGITMIVTSNKKIVAKINESQNENAENENNLYFPDLEIDYNLNNKASKKNSSISFLSYFDQVNLGSSGYIYSPTESSIDVQNNSIYIEGVPIPILKELFCFSSMYKTNDDDNENNFVENEYDKQPYSFVNSESIM